MKYIDELVYFTHSIMSKFKILTFSSSHLRRSGDDSSDRTVDVSAGEEDYPVKKEGVIARTSATSSNAVVKAKNAMAIQSAEAADSSGSATEVNSDTEEDDFESAEAKVGVTPATALANSDTDILREIDSLLNEEF
jgi:hypothetical protein